MTRFGSLKIGMPLLGLGITLAFAPQSRAQADAAPDNFEVAYDAAPLAVAKVAAPKPKQLTTPSAQAAKKKPGTHATLQVASDKTIPESERPDLLAIQDKRKTSAHKPNNK
jgi:hypothetical protein